MASVSWTRTTAAPRTKCARKSTILRTRQSWSRAANASPNVCSSPRTVANSKKRLWRRTKAAAASVLPDDKTQINQPANEPTGFKLKTPSWSMGGASPSLFHKSGDAHEDFQQIDGVGQIAVTIVDVQGKKLLVGLEQLTFFGHGGHAHGHRLGGKARPALKTSPQVGIGRVDEDQPRRRHDLLEDQGPMQLQDAQDGPMPLKLVLEGRSPRAVPLTAVVDRLQKFADRQAPIKLFRGHEVVIATVRFTDARCPRSHRNQPAEIGQTPQNLVRQSGLADPGRAAKDNGNAGHGCSFEMKDLIGILLIEARMGKRGEKERKN